MMILENAYAFLEIVIIKISLWYMNFSVACMHLLDSTGVLIFLDTFLLRQTLISFVILLVRQTWFESTVQL